MKLAERFDRAIAPAREAYEGLNDRERMLVGMMSAVALLIAIVLPMYFTLDSIAEMERENTEIQAFLRQLEQQRTSLRARIEEREATSRRYEQKAPPLATFLETEARRQGLTIREVTDEPDQALEGFTRRRVRATIADAQFAAFVNMLASIENSQYPVALERIEVDHFRRGEAYTVRLGVDAYDRDTPAAADRRRESRPNGNEAP